MNMSNSNDRKWMKKYELSVEYCKLNNCNRVPRSCKFKGENIGTWFGHQVGDYNAGKLSQEKIDLFNKGNLSFEDPRESNWMEYYEAAAKYCKENNCNRVPKRYKVDGLDVGKWHQHQLEAYNNGKMPDDRIDLFERAGMYLGNSLEERWMKRFNLFLEYKEEMGNPYISSTLIYKGENLGRWAENIRNSFKDGTLPAEKLELLKEAGFDFENTYVDYVWNQRFNDIKDFIEYTKNSYIPYNLRSDDNCDLTSWLDHQIDLYKNNTLSSERKAMLDSIGYPFEDKIGNSVASFDETICCYYARKLFDDVSFRDTSNGFEIDVYIKHNNKVAGIEYDGERYHKDEDRFERDLKKTKMCCELKIPLYRIRYEDIGSLKVNDYFYNEHFIEGKQEKSTPFSLDFKKKLEKVLSDICKDLNVNKEINIDVQRDIKEICKLRFDLADELWQRKYDIYKDCLMEYGNVPTSHSMYYVLNNWVNKQRSLYEEGALPEDKKKLLDELVPHGFAWKKDPLGEWGKSYLIYKEYCEVNHTNHAPYEEKYKGLAVGNWESRQRTAYKKGELSQEKIDLLNKINFPWEEPPKGIQKEPTASLDDLFGSVEDRYNAQSVNSKSQSRDCLAI